MPPAAPGGDGDALVGVTGAADGAIAPGVEGASRREVEARERVAQLRGLWPVLVGLVHVAVGDLVGEFALTLVGCCGRRELGSVAVE